MVFTLRSLSSVLLILVSLYSVNKIRERDQSSSVPLFTLQSYCEVRLLPLIIWFTGMKP